MSQTVILSSARTPTGKLGGVLASLDASELGAAAIQAALKRAQVPSHWVEHVIMGQVLQAGQGPVPSRQAQIKAGIPKEVSSETINKVCASGMRAVGLLDTAIRAGDLELGVAGGMESMSKAPYVLKDPRFPLRLARNGTLDTILHDGLTNPFSGKHVAQEASEAAAHLELGRAEMDRWALRSHERAIRAIDDGRLSEEICAVTIHSRSGSATVEFDEPPRRDTSLAELAQLKPLFTQDGTHTAGNSPGLNDGSTALVLSCHRWARTHGHEALATIISQAQVADEFACLARTPARAAKSALAKVGLNAQDVDLWEIDEAFASVSLNTVRALQIDAERVNVNGGAVALGHPIGASGARILGTLVHELRRRGGGIGCATICSGGGQGDAVIVEVADANVENTHHRCPTRAPGCETTPTQRR